MYIFYCHYYVKTANQTEVNSWIELKEASIHMKQN